MENNVKGLKKQLVAAIAMVLVAGVALGSSTFAWFVNNTSVKAQGMQVNAVASGSLVIKGMTDSTDTEFTSIGTVGSASNDRVLKKELAPATSYDGKNFGILASNVKVQSANNSAATWTGAEGVFDSSNIETLTPENDSAYVLKAQYKIASVGESCEVYVSNVSVTATNVEKALRMSVTIGGTTYVYNIGGGEAAYVGKLTNDVWSLVAPSYDQTTAGYKWALTEVPEATNSTATDVDVRVWYEGQDADCFSNNVTLNGSAITIEFAKVPKQ